MNSKKNYFFSLNSMKFGESKIKKKLRSFFSKFFAPKNLIFSIFEQIKLEYPYPPSTTRLSPKKKFHRQTEILPAYIGDISPNLATLNLTELVRPNRIRTFEHALVVHKKD